jgi:hypothetical protein
MNELTEKVSELSGVKCLLEEKDESFAASLCEQWTKKQRLSDKQVYWVDKLITKALNSGDDGPDTAVKIGDFAKMIALFEKASAKIKRPSLTFRIPHASDDVKLVLKRAGVKSKYNGQLMLTDGKPYGESLWYGRIDLDGVFIPSAKGEEFTDVLVPFLITFAENPHETASGYGHKTGNCCFCHLGLTQANSVAVGYGPVCASNWGLKSEWKNAVNGATQ